MARSESGTVFAEAAGKTVESIEYTENPDYQALIVAFSDGTVFSFEFGARVVVEAIYFEHRKGNAKVIRRYGSVPAASR